MQRTFTAALAVIATLASGGCNSSKSDDARPEQAPTSVAAPSTAAPSQGGVLLGPRVEALSGEDWNAGQIEWLSYEAGAARAKEQSKPMCLVFWASWCSHCKVYSHVFEDPRIVEMARKFVMIRANVDDEEALAARYAPDGGYVPRTLFLSPEGALQREVHAERPNFIHFYDERDPASLLGGMKTALRILGK